MSVENSSQSKPPRGRRAVARRGDRIASQQEPGPTAPAERSTSASIRLRFPGVRLAFDLVHRLKSAVK